MLNRQICLPVRTSNARTSPFLLLCVETVAPSRNDDPMYDDVPHYGWSRVDADLAGFEIRFVHSLPDDADLQIEHAFGWRMTESGLLFRVELHELISGRDVDDALVAFAVGPVRDSAARQLPR